MRPTARPLTLPMLAVLAVALAACGDKTPPRTGDSTVGPVFPTSSPAGLPGAPGASKPLPFTLPVAPDSTSTPPSESPMTAIVGKQAPAFRLKDHTGQERTLAEFQGKRVVLWFFPKANTGG